MNFIVYFVSINIFTFIICAIDKWKAIYNKWRISEKVLLLFSLFGGCFGMVVAMLLFHHKTRKLKFKLIYVFCVMWVYLIYNFLS